MISKLKTMGEALIMPPASRRHFTGLSNGGPCRIATGLEDVDTLVQCRCLPSFSLLEGDQNTG